MLSLMMLSAILSILGDDE